MNLVRLQYGGGGSGELHGAELVITTEETTLAGELVELYKDADSTPVQVNRFSTIASDGKYSARFVIQEVGTYKVESSDGVDTAKREEILITSDDVINKLSITDTISFWEATPWTTGSFEGIADMLERHYQGLLYVADYWAIGDEKEIELPQIANGGLVSETQPVQTVKLKIIGFSHDDLETPINGVTKSAITVQTELSTLGNMHPTAPQTRNFIYTQLNRRAWLNDQFYNALPCKDLVKPVIKKTANYQWTKSGLSNPYINTTNSKENVFLTSRAETTTEYISLGKPMNEIDEEMYEYYTNSSNKPTKKYPFRNVVAYDTNGICIHVINANGSLSWPYVNTNDFTICPCFNL